MDLYKIGEGVLQGCILSPCFFNVYVEYIMSNAGWMKHKLESNFEREINNDRYADDTTIITESEEELKSLWMRVKEES